MLQFSHIDKKALEVLFEKDLTRNLFQYQNDIKRSLLKKRDKYNLLLNNYRNKTIGNNVKLIHDFLEFNDSGMFSTIRNYSGISYAMGMNMALTEFKIEQKPLLNHFEKMNEINESQKLTDNILSLYTETIKELLMDNIVKNSNFSMFIGEIHTMFNKSKDVKKAQSRDIFLPSFPMINEIVNNVKIAHTTSSFVRGMVDTFKSTGSVSKMMYKTQEYEKVSAKCRKWHGTVLSIDKLEGIIPQHLNCRCRWIPDT